MRIQEKLLKKIFQEIEGAGLEVVHNPAWANTGKVYVQRPSDFESLLSFCYDFQGRYFTLHFYGASTEPKATCGFTHESCIKDCHAENTDSQKIKDVLDFLKEQVQKLTSKTE